MCIEDPLCARYSAGCWGHVDGLGRGPALRNFTVWLRLESRLCVLLPQNQVHCEVKGLLDGALGPVYLFIFFPVYKHGAAAEGKSDFLRSVVTVYFQQHLLLNGGLSKGKLSQLYY